MKRAHLVAILLVSSAGGWASSTAFWEMNTYQDFLRGRFSGVSLTRDGRMTLAPRLETLLASDQPAIWSLAEGADGAVFAGSGHSGRVYRLDRNGGSTVVWTADQPEVFAVAVDAKGVLHAATSPDGKVFRIENGKAKEYFAPGTKYIWALAFGPDGNLYVGTGDQGKIFRVTAPGQGEVWYDTGQAHITCLAFDHEGRLLAGSEPNGILYRVQAKDKAFVLYDANLPEIRSIVAAPDGTIYAAALGGAMAGRAGAGLAGAAGGATAPVVASPGTSITVTETQAGPPDLKPKTDAAKPQPQPGAQVTTQFSPLVDMSGVEKSAVYRINPDNTVETLWTSKEENVYDLLPSGSSLLLATDGQGRIYRLAADRRATLLLQTNEGETTRLLNRDGELLAATGAAGKILRLTDGSGISGTYEAPVHDSGTVARWGRLSWRANAGPDTRLAFRTRSGNSARPDKTWSDWSDPITDPARAAIQSPNARYVQWKAEFSGGQGKSPVLDSITLAYLPQNLAPQVRSISVVTQWTGAAASKIASTQPAPSSAYSITVTDTGEPGASSATGTPAQTLARASSQQMVISWLAEDTDGDRLVYTVHFRGDDEQEWKLLKANVAESSMTFDADVLADGKYFFRVTASDRLNNPQGSARDAALVSSPVLIDNTPPVVTAGQPRRNGARVEVEVEAADGSLALRRAEYSVDAGTWVPLEATDGVTDSARESFAIRIDELAPGEHLIVIRVYDLAGNPGLAKVVVR